MLGKYHHHKPVQISGMENIVMLDKVVYEKLSAKLVDILNYKSKTELDKKVLVSGMNIEIKAAKEKSDVIAKVIATRDLELMVHCGFFDEYELKELIGKEAEDFDI